MAASAAASASGSAGEGTSKPFRFKARSQEDSESGLPPRKRHRGSRTNSRHHHHRRRHHRSHRSDPPPDTPPLSPESAFRESLFDALADDEGAAFWEGVYGQPIHNYSRYAPRTAAAAAATAADDDDDGAADEDATHPDGTPVLECMSDEAYAAYVRARMWERSREAVELERAQRAQEKAEERRRAESARQTAERQRARWASEERRRRAKREGRSDDDRRGKERPRAEHKGEARAAWDHGPERDPEWPSAERIRAERGRWETYLQRWKDLPRSAGRSEQAPAAPVERDDPAGTRPRQSKLRMPWPVSSGRAADVAPLAVERFLRIGAARMATCGDARGKQLARLVKSERVRWHPDRMTRLDLDDLTTKQVTAVFQIIDRFWQQLKDSGADGR